MRLFVLRTTIFYNRDEIREKGDKNDIDNGYDLWMDVVEPSSEAFLISKRNLARMLTL